jgi:hypothetical protein
MKKAQKATGKASIPSGIAPKIKSVISKYVPKNTNAQKGG